MTYFRGQLHSVSQTSCSTAQAAVGISQLEGLGTTASSDWDYFLRWSDVGESSHCATSTVLHGIGQTE